ncbi:MAG: methyltransferase domain-containing protein [Anaerolineae bacterium]|nr:methyltransferase domain-containing protein [Anaerolineae bacterium]
MSLRFHEIAERDHVIQNPITLEKLDAIGAACGFQPGMHLLDLACGRGEMLTRWAAQYGIGGTGVDISAAFLTEARRRARERRVIDRVTFVQADAGKYLDDTPGEAGTYDVVSCVGATWIGGGTPGTLAIMRRALKDQRDGLLLVGDVYWARLPVEEAAYAVMGEESRAWAHGLPAMLEMFNQTGFDLVQMSLANPDSWDAYYAPQWRSVFTWLREHPDDPDYAALRAWIDRNQRGYLRYERDYCGWGLFLLQPKLD